MSNLFDWNTPHAAQVPFSITSLFIWVPVLKQIKQPAGEFERGHVSAETVREGAEWSDMNVGGNRKPKGGTPAVSNN